MTTGNGVKADTQFSVFLINKPGILAKVVQRLATDKINIVALSMMDSTEHGVLRLVVEDAAKARASLASLDLPKQETSVLTATLPNRPGALADVVERLAAEHINIHYAYCTTGPAGGKTLGIFKVADQSKAMHVLGERKPKRKTEIGSTLRAASRGRR